MSLMFCCLYALASLASAILISKKQMHMFQLSSYSGEAYLRWLKHHKLSLFCSAIPAFLMFCSGLLRHKSSALLVCAEIVMILIGVMNVETSVKKPLVCTPRVIRMFSTMFVLSVAILVICSRCQLQWAFACASLLLAVLPLLIIIANGVNMPIENAIKQHYIHEAKDILQAANTMRVIGITGSFGKTSVKYFLASILRAKFDILMTPGNYNTAMGVVKTVREHYSPTNQIFICEMGARHVGDIKEICDIVHPNVGIITSIGSQHLETFHSLENIKRTKYELANSLTEDAPLFLNGDDPNIMSVPHKDSAILYGLQNHSGYYADNITVSEQGTSFVFHTPNAESFNFSTKMLGQHNVLNIVAASAVAHYLGIPLSVICSRVKKLEVVPHRLQLLKNANGAIIDDAYNSNPQGAKAALDVLAMFEGMKILITPGMVELGDQQDNYNFQFGQQAAAVCDYIILVGEQQTQAIQRGISSTQFPSEKVFISKDFTLAMKAVSKLPSSQKKYVLLENDLPDNY